jgi:hypothetical protein
MEVNVKHLDEIVVDEGRRWGQGWGRKKQTAR